MCAPPSSPLFFGYSALSSSLYYLAALSDEGGERVDVGAPASRSSEAAPSLARGLGATGTANLGLLCTVDFRVSTGARSSAKRSRTSPPLRAWCSSGACPLRRCSGLSKQTLQRYGL